MSGRLASRLDEPAQDGGAPADDREVAAYRMLVGSLFTSPTSIVSSNILGAVVPLFCWAITDQWPFLALAVVAAIVVGLRCLTVRNYLRGDHGADSYEETRRWDREYLAGAALYSALVGLVACTALVDTRSMPAHLGATVAAIAFASGYVARNAGRPSFAITQILCCLVPTAIGLWLASEPYYAWLAAFALVYGGVNVAVTFSLNRNLVALAEASSTSRELAETLRVKHNELDSALNAMTHGLVMFNGRLEIEVSNSRFAALYGLDAEPPTSERLDDVAARLARAGAIAEADARELARLCRKVHDGRKPAVAELAATRGRTYVVSVEPAPEGGVLVLTEDATGRKAAAAQIERMAHYDSLTGLANRFLFTQALKTSCAAVAAGHGEPFAVLSVDLDNFKAINDTLGHEAGDRVLIESAARLRGEMAGGDLVARFGGDEFLILTRAAEPEAASRFAARIIARLSEPGSTGLVLTASIGIALVPVHGVEPSDLLRDSDVALYEAKGAGRNTALIFDRSMSEALGRRREIENDLRSAVESGRLLLHYQPVVDLASGRTRSYEALMRWDHPVRGLIPPSDFIPISEQTGLICEIGVWALRQACLDAAGWPGDLSVAVNVSPVQFRDTPQLIAAVKAALKESGLPPHRLEIEVTESLLIEDERATLKAIRALRRLGVRFSLDDFGIGYSSLAYLARYPFSKVKIDRSFAQHVTNDGPSRAIIEAVGQLARRLGMQVVVEGIETAEQRAEVKRLGVDQAQGYLFGRPEPLAGLVHLPEPHRQAA